MQWVIVLLAILTIFWGLRFTATLNLRATWSANTKSDMKEYRPYRKEGTRTWIGTLPHPKTSHNFSVTVPDQSSGNLKLVLTAVDTNNNESTDSSPVTYRYNLDPFPPVAPRSL